MLILVLIPNQQDILKKLKQKISTPERNNAPKDKSVKSWVAEQSVDTESGKNQEAKYEPQRVDNLG